MGSVRLGRHIWIPQNLHQEGGKQFGDRHETVRETLRWAPTLLRTNQEFDEFMDNGK